MNKKNTIDTRHMIKSPQLCHEDQECVPRYCTHTNQKHINDTHLQMKNG